VFTPMVLSGCLGWVRISAPQSGARAACLAVTTHIHLMRPDIPLRDLDARAEAAIRALEDGADSVTVIDDQHRVDRTGPRSSASTAVGQ
jgi:ribosomal protein S11